MMLEHQLSERQACECGFGGGLLDDKDTSLTFTTLASAAAALGKRVNVEWVAA